MYTSHLSVGNNLVQKEEAVQYDLSNWFCFLVVSSVTLPIPAYYIKQAHCI